MLRCVRRLTSLCAVRIFPGRMGSLRSASRSDGGRAPPKTALILSRYRPPRGACLDHLTGGGCLQPEIHGRRRPRGVVRPPSHSHPLTELSSWRAACPSLPISSSGQLARHPPAPPDAQPPQLAQPSYPPHQPSAPGLHVDHRQDRRIAWPTSRPRPRRVPTRAARLRAGAQAQL
jgi:hypothetical protein